MGLCFLCALHGQVYDSRSTDHDLLQGTYKRTYNRTVRDKDLPAKETNSNRATGSVLTMRILSVRDSQSTPLLDRNASQRRLSMTSTNKGRFPGLSGSE